jgi:hypothetical protein
MKKGWDGMDVGKAVTTKDEVPVLGEAKNGHVETIRVLIFESFLTGWKLGYDANN